MSLHSQDSAFDLGVFHERIRVARDPSPDVQANADAETDFRAVGALFGDRRESDPRPNSIELSEGEEAAMHPLPIPCRAELFSDADAVVSGNAVPSRSPATPTPTQPHLGSYIHPSDMPLVREQRDRRLRRGRKRNRGSQSSVDTPDGQRQVSDTSSRDADDDEENERGRSTTPTPYIPQSYTPSHHSQQTDEDHGEGRGPLSPNPYSTYFPYNPHHRQRTEAIEGIEEHFAVDEQPRA